MKDNIFEDSVVLITGADGGIGTAFVEELIKHKVHKIYASGLILKNLIDLSQIAPNIIIPVKLDITKKNKIDECIKQCNDTNILINNAGVELKSGFLDDDISKKLSFEMNVNFIGGVELTNEFVKLFKNRENSAIINILSIASLIYIKNIGTYCASKVAFHLYTQAIREELEGLINVYAVYPGYVDTKMVSDVKTEKILPTDLVKNICNEIILGNLNIFPDNMSKKYINSNKLKLENLF